jgi:predicted O-linked N-acetylglucosamine transferase (SPINDLY family)
MEGFSPEFTTALAMQRAGRLDQAENIYRRLLREQSQATLAHSALGVLLSSQGRHAEARQHYQQVVRANPGDALTHRLLADSCSADGDVASSQQHYRAAANHQPDNWLAQMRAEIVAPLVYQSNAEIDEYRARLEQFLTQHLSGTHTFDWNELACSGCKPPLALAYQGRDDKPLKELFARVFAAKLPADLPRGGTGKPHVGFVVTTGNEGVFLRGMARVVRALDLRQLRVTVVCDSKAEGKFRREIEREINYLPLAPRFTDTLNAVRQARFDVLYYWEIGTDCVNYFLPFFRLASVQCTSWGWPVTSGIAEVDYFLSCGLLEPAGAEQHYTERLVRLKHLPNDYALPKAPGLMIDRDGALRPGARRLYFCGQNPRKMHPDFDELLRGILQSDPHGVVALVESTKPALGAALKRRMAATLGDVYDRVTWLPRMSAGEYLGWMAVADCVLDTPHYSAGANSSYDAFGVGAAMVTLRGEYHRGRYTAAAYAAMGITDGIADTPAEYVRYAVQLASDDDMRRHMRNQIVERRDVLFNNSHAASELQEFLLTAAAN